jgi:protocatechuate 3,4-dioxygenase beta subunit
MRGLGIGVDSREWDRKTETAISRWPNLFSPICVDKRMGAVRLLAFIVTLPFVVLAQDKPPEKGTLSGTVVNYVTGEPLDKVDIETEVAGTRGGSAGSTTTDANGHFVISNLDPGQYRLKGKRNRFLGTYYGARRAGSNGVPIVLEAGQTITDLQFKLLPFGVIAGTIRDAEGEPLARVVVTALRVKFEEGRRKVTAVDAAFTDDEGQYRITGLAPGRYYVRADPKPKSPGGMMEGNFIAPFVVITTDAGGTPSATPSQPKILMPALYPGVQAPEAARTIDLETGARVMGTDIVLPRSGTVRVKGHVTAPDGSRASMVSLSRGQWMGNSLDARLMASADEHGDFVFPAVPPGLYILTASAAAVAEAHVSFTPNSGPGIMIMEESHANYEGRMPLEVGTTPVDGIQVVISGGATVTGIVVQAGDKGSVPGGSVEFDDGVSDIRRSDILDGRFSLDLPQGHYHVYLNPDGVAQDGPLLIRSARWDGRDIVSEGLTIAGPGKVSLEIMAAPDGGKLEGIALDKDDKPVAGATVVLIPESGFRTRNDRYYTADTDQYGHFELDGIAPGDYKAFAWDDVEPGVWRDAEFVKSIESKGEALTLKTGARESVKVHLVK